MFTIWDLLLPPIYLFIIFFIADIIRKRNIVSDDAYKYFTYGLFAKILGGIFLCLVQFPHPSKGNGGSEN